MRDRSVARLVARLVGRPLFWATLVLGLAGVSIARAVVASRRLPPPIPVLATVPGFSLVGEDGRPFGAARLRGRVWIANFIYTRCPTICPAFTRKMFDIQHRARNLGDAFHLVSFTADPDYDTPERLAAYARQHRASPRMWTFVTGRIDDVKKTVVEGLRVSMGREGSGGDFASIFHGTHFVVVDARMRVRAYVDSSRADAVDRVLHTAGLLINRGD